MAKYVQDPDDSKKVVGGTLPDNAYDRSINVQTCSLQKKPSAVLIAQTPAENIGFRFGSSASFSSDATSEHRNLIASVSHALTGSESYTDFGKPAAGTTLNISPCAWSGSVEAATGHIVFIYKSGLGSGGV